MDDESRRFYSRIFATAMLNWHAVKMGYYDTLIVDMTTKEDADRWVSCVPLIMTAMRGRSKDGR